MERALNKNVVKKIRTLKFKLNSGDKLMRNTINHLHCITDGKWYNRFHQS